MEVTARVTFLGIVQGNIYEVIGKLPAAYPTHYRVIGDDGVKRVLNMNKFERGSANDE